MTPSELRRLIANLPETPPLTTALELHLAAREGRPPPDRTQKEHWLGWLAEYRQPGAYGRQRFDRDARFAYNHFQCAPGVLWLGEAAGAPDVAVQAAFTAAVAAGPAAASRCAAIRQILPWPKIEALMRIPP